MSERIIAETVPQALDGERLDRVVAFMTGFSRSASRVVVDAGGVTIDGECATSGKVRLAVGQSVAVDLAAYPKPPDVSADPTVQFDAVYVDDYIVVVDKPPGLVVHPGAGHSDGTLVNGLLARYPDIAGVGESHRSGIVHRLDAGSSGLLVVARTQAAADDLIEQFSTHHAKRRYTALVWGHPSASHAVIDAPIGRSKRDPLRMAVVADGRWARTEYTVEQRFDRPTELALLSCELETGRTHQIRVHLSSINHPLVGDPIYGQRRPKLQLDRPFLHAAQLAFDHPASGEPVAFESPLAPDLATRLSSLTPVGNSLGDA